MKEILDKKPNKENAVRILNKYSTLLEDARKASPLLLKYQTEIAKYSSIVAEEEIPNVLKEIDVSTLNDGSLRINIKALKYAGFCTYFDIYESMQYIKLHKIQGLSAQTISEIEKKLNKTIEDVRKNVSPRISIENKTPASSSLVLSLYQYQETLPWVKTIESVCAKYAKYILKYIEEASVLKNGFAWLLASKKKKASAISAYLELKSLDDSGVRENLRYCLDKLKEIENAKIDSAWKDFEISSVRYFSTLELLQGYKTSNEGAKKNLSNDLAESIDNVKLDLTGLKCTLRGYQDFGVKYILHQGKGLLGDDMGLGKTIQAIASMVAVRNLGETRFLVVCPASVLINWCREITTHSDLIPIKIHGENRDEIFEQWVAQGGVAVTTYETLSKLNFVSVGHISMLVVDEAHYVKNPYALRTKKLLQVKRVAERILYMTGTALENKVEEMCFLIKTLNPALAKELIKLQELSSAKLFRQKVAPVYFRRTRADVLKELPDMTEIDEWCEMTDEERSLYLRSTMDENFMSMRQVSWQVDDVSKSSKANRLWEIYTKAVEEKRKIIVFSYFLNTLKQVEKMFAGRCFGPITGAVQPDERQGIIDEFSKSKDGSVLIAQVQAGGVGLNIQSASIVVLCEPQLKPSTESQAIGRAYRMGQVRNVIVYRLLCEESVDERIMEILDTKEIIFNNFADKSTLGKHSIQITEQLRKKIIETEIARLQKDKEGEING